MTFFLLNSRNFKYMVTTLVVSDVGRSLNFYSDVVGMKQVMRPNFDRYVQCNGGSFQQKHSLLQQTMTLFQGPKDPVCQAWCTLCLDFSVSSRFEFQGIKNASIMHYNFFLYFLPIFSKELPKNAKFSFSK